MVRRARRRDSRKQRRYGTDVPVLIHRSPLPVLGVQGGEFEAECCDVSGTGVRFVTDERIYRWERVKLTFFNCEGRAEVRCEAQVLRTSRITNGKYEVACKMLKTLPLKEPSKQSDR